MSPTGHAALDLTRRGFAVVPLVPGTKHPRVPWKAYQTERPTPETVEGWYRECSEAGIALVLGQVSNLVVVDFDDRDAEQQLARYLPPTPTVETARGAHYYFRPPRTLGTICALLDGLDLKGESSLATAPPSIHPSGMPYRWREGRDLDALLIAPLPRVLLDLIAAYRRRREDDERAVLASLRRRQTTAGDLALADVVDHTRARRAGRGWSGFCPAHDDRTPSLSIAQGDGGRLLLHCHAGCLYTDIRAALAGVLV